MDVRLVEPSELPQARDILVRAFMNDPALRYYMPHEQKRALLLGKLYTDVLRVALPQRGVFTLVDGLHSVMVRLLPGERSISLFDVIQPSLLTVVRSMGIFWIPRALLYLLLTERMHARIAPEPHLYLFLLGVDPACQSSGMGRSLLAHALREADDKRLPAYLETFNPRTLPFYERHGFKVITTRNIAFGGPQGWFMRREATPS